MSPSRVPPSTTLAANSSGPPRVSVGIILIFFWYGVHMPHSVRAVRRARRAGSTGSVRRVTDPFRQGLWNFFDGTATGRFFDSTAVEIMAVEGRRIL
jgi:hypothetical protein